MSEDKLRAAFETAIPIPEGVYWSEPHNNYMTSTHHVPCLQYRGSWIVWQASRASYLSLLEAMVTLHASLRSLNDSGDAGRMVEDDVALARAAIARATGERP